MQEQIERLTRQYRDAGSEALNRVRGALDNGAEWVEDGKGPLQVLTDSTLKLNRISHNSAARLVRVQAQFVEGTIEGTARRLHSVAKADSVRDLIDGQVQLMPATRDRLVTDARKTLELFGDTRDDITALLRETLTELRGDKAVSRVAKGVDEVRSKARKAAPATRRPRKTTARKTTARKTTRKPARKTAAGRKTTTRRKTTRA